MIGQDEILVEKGKNKIIKKLYRRWKVGERFSPQKVKIIRKRK